MRLACEDLSAQGKASFETIDLSDMIRRVNRYMSTRSYEQALQWINRYIKMNSHSRDTDAIDTLLDIKVQIILVQAEQVVTIDPKKAIEYCKEAYECYESIDKKETDYKDKINYILKILYDHHIQYQKLKELYKLMRKAREGSSGSAEITNVQNTESDFGEWNYLAHKLKEGLANAQEIELIWPHKWRRKLHILGDMQERYFHSKRDLDQIGSFYEHGREEFYFSPDLHSKEHPHREVSLVFYNNDFFVAKDRIVQDVLGTLRMMNRKVYGKSKVRLKTGVRN